MLQPDLDRLAAIVAELREKCPWDRVQTKESLRPLTLEEAYELSEAVLKGDYDEMRAESGDLLLHVVFYAQLAREAGKYELGDVIRQLIEKLIRRHPHVYGEAQAASADAVRENWEQIKLREREQQNQARPSVLDGVPASLPSLIKAQRLQEKAAGLKFDWDNLGQVWEKVEEEMQEVREAATPEHRAEEIGDLFFALVNYARFQGLSADELLERASAKFQKRFRYIEVAAQDRGSSLDRISLDEMEELWQEAKRLP
jgi:XTP/dITP diphosphohydrolase